MLRRILAIGFAAVLCWASATAQASKAAVQQRLVTRICTSDVSARCAAVRGDRDGMRNCVKEHLRELSGPCQASLARLAALATACAADVRQSCAKVKPGHGRIEACLQAGLADVSDTCKDALAQAAAGAP